MSQLHAAEELQGMLDAIPYVRDQGLCIELDEDGAVVVRMPWRDAVANHAGGWHAAALYCVAETAGGVAAWLIVGDPTVAPLVREATIRYRRRPEGDVVATALVGADVAAAARAAVQADGRADVDVAVSTTDATGSDVLDVRFDYALRRL